MKVSAMHETTLNYSGLHSIQGPKTKGYAILDAQASTMKKSRKIPLSVCRIQFILSQYSPTCPYSMNLLAESRC
jgi:hypothetical protein